jgi:uncharacterized membrane protein
MTNLFPPLVGKIVTDYLERLDIRLKGIPESDRRDLTEEIRSHIFESFNNEPGEDEIDRIQAVLRRLGEPSDVISSHMPQAMSRVAYKRKAPLYILAGILIALLGLPLGLGAVVFLAGLMVTLAGLLLGYFSIAASLTAGGIFSALAFFLFLVFPHFYHYLGTLAGHPLIEFRLLNTNPILGGFIGLIASSSVAALGLYMFWASKRIWRGLRFVADLILGKIRHILTRGNRKVA